MIDGIPAVSGCVSRFAETGPSVDAFLAKAAGGVGIEELILQDTQAQRRASTAIRRAQREQRRNMVEQAVKKMKAAADDRFWSGVVGALSGIAGEVLGVVIQSEWTKVICEGTKFLGGNLAKHLLFDIAAVEKEGDAKLLQDAAQATGARHRRVAGFGQGSGETHGGPHGSADPR